MYRQLQEKVKQYVISRLCQISEEWKFDINEDTEKPLIIGYGPNGVIIRTYIEELQCYATNKLLNDISVFCDSGNKYVKGWEGCSLLKILINSVFTIYNIQNSHYTPLLPRFIIRNKNNTRKISNYIWPVLEDNKKVYHFICPFRWDTFIKYVTNEQFVSPILLLLDPITYFRKYSDLIQLFPQLGKNHTWGTYELLLEYFPEMNPELYDRYLTLCSIFSDNCGDIVEVVVGMLVELYVC